MARFGRGFPVPFRYRITRVGSAPPAGPQFVQQAVGSSGAASTTLSAVFGAALSSRLAHYLSEAFAQAGVQPGVGGTAIDANNVQAIQRLTGPVKHLVLTAFSNALDDVFLIGVPFIVVAFVVSWFLKEVPLRTGPGPGGPAPDGQLPAETVGAP